MVYSTMDKKYKIYQTLITYTQSHIICQLSHNNKIDRLGIQALK
jgi:hypothetical protein